MTKQLTVAHTPGPWSIQKKRGKSERYDGKWLVNGPIGLNPSVTGETRGVPVADVHLSESDARLIAAAPELLAALEMLRRCPQAMTWLAQLPVDPNAHGIALSGQIVQTGQTVADYINTAMTKATEIT